MKLHAGFAASRRRNEETSRLDDEDDRAGHRRREPLGDREPVDVGQLDVQQDDLGAQAARRPPSAPSSASPTTSKSPASRSARAAALKPA